MNKKGMLLAEETLKIVIGVICIGFLAYLLVSLYFSAQQSKELEQARETLPYIMSQISDGRPSVDVYNPKDWWLLTWDNGIGAPNECSQYGTDGCICICEESTAESCDETGICLDNENYVIEEPIQIENPPTTLDLSYSPKRISKEDQ